MLNTLPYFGSNDIHNLGISNQILILVMDCFAYVELKKADRIQLLKWRHVILFIGCALGCNYYLHVHKCMSWIDDMSVRTIGFITTTCIHKLYI